MPNTDLQGLHGFFPTPLRFGAETGQLSYSMYNAATGERTIEAIVLGSRMAMFALDMFTREVGYLLIRPGLYDARLAPVGSPKPEWPGDDDYKAAIGCWMWSPDLGELRLETCAVNFRDAIVNIWDQCQRYKEYAEGQVPIVHFTGRQERLVKSVGKIFFVPTINILKFVPRDLIEPFALRPPTVKPPPALDSRIALLERLHREEPKLEKPALTRDKAKTKPGAAPKRGSPDDDLDDEIPPFDK